MDKKKEISFNLNNFLLALSLPLDYVRKFKCSSPLNHSKRVTYIALNIGKQLNLTPQEMSDLCSYSLLHSIGLLSSSNLSKEYCEASNNIADIFPFLLDKKNILKYQNEYFDGSGIYGLKDEQIPLLSQILSLSITIENRFDLSQLAVKDRAEVIEFVKSCQNELFSKDLVDIFLLISERINFWLDLQNENEILYFIFANLYDFTITLKFEELLKITSSIFELTNKESKLLINLEKMIDFYKFEHKDKFTFLIAASLCGIGKLCIDPQIINKKTELEKWEYEDIKSYPYFTKRVLTNIMGFDDISSWAIKIQERQNGKGYPFSLKGKDLSLKDRLLAAVNSFSALTSNKVYRKAYSKDEAISILKNSAEVDDCYDLSIIQDLEKVL
ncbi:HD-GYP domain-containing protein [Arcobacter sp.]|uniref:HD-GYP domain-containing protein n=1 Tax=Arcobacter sp. TaxID=1872629 RepID=UPI003D0B2FD1